MKNNRGTHNHTTDHQCIKSLIEVFLYIDGQLDEQRASEIEEHLTYCKECYGRVQFEKLVKGYVKSRSSHDSPSDEMVDSVSKMFESE